MWEKGRDVSRKGKKIKLHNSTSMAASFLQEANSKLANYPLRMEGTSEAVFEKQIFIKKSNKTCISTYIVDCTFHSFIRMYYKIRSSESILSSQ